MANALPLSPLCQLWMGNVEPFMTHQFILNAFRKMGEQPTSIQLMYIWQSGQPARYCFISFASTSIAMDAMHRLNGKPIPFTDPPVRFRLNIAHSTNNANRNERDYSVWVGSLSPDVDNYKLYKAFANFYSSVKKATVINDDFGLSKGYGFVRFGLEAEQKLAVYNMTGFLGLGTKLLKVRKARSPGPRNAFRAAAAVGQNMSCRSSISNLTNYSLFFDKSDDECALNSWQDYYDYYQDGDDWGEECSERPTAIRNNIWALQNRSAPNANKYN